MRFIQQIPRRELTRPRPRAAWRVRRYTLLSYDRLAVLHDLARLAPQGAFVECGVCEGGSAGMTALADPDRDIWLFDSWEGLCPSPDPKMSLFKATDAQLAGTTPSNNASSN